MRIASITAGAAGMFCGSCLHDNTLAAALIRHGHDCLQLPTFTPLTLDEPDQSTGRIFLGGVNVYLDEYPLFRALPRWLRGWLDRPAILRLATRFAGVEDYERLGNLTLSMLRGEHGRQRMEFAQLLDYLTDEIKPDVVLLTNLLLSGVVPLIRQRLNVPIVISLQGDDIFLEALAAAHRQEALKLIRENSAAAAGFIATSRYYADFMAGYIGLPREKIRVIYPGIRLKHHAGERTGNDVPTVGYFARICPEKGLHQLLDAMEKLPEARLRISGWLGAQHKKYLAGQLGRLAGRDAQYVESPTMTDKVRFLRSLDVLSVPTVYREPKGLYVIEALANGVPVVLPAHGSFPELVEQSGGGILVPPGNADALADSLRELLTNHQHREKLGTAGAAAVRDRFSDDRMAAETVAVLNELTPL